MLKPDLLYPDLDGLVEQAAVGRSETALEALSYLLLRAPAPVRQASLTALSRNRTSLLSLASNALLEQHRPSLELLCTVYYLMGLPYVSARLRSYPLDAQGVLQGALLAFIKYGPRRWTPDRPPTLYFLAILRNACLDAVRSLQRQPVTASLDVAARRLTMPVPEVVAAELKGFVQQACIQLSDRHRQVVAFAMDGLSQDEIAERLSTTRAKVRRLFWQAQRALDKTRLYAAQPCLDY